MSDTSVDDYKNEYRQILGGGNKQVSDATSAPSMSDQAPQVQPEEDSVESYKNQYRNLMGGQSFASMSGSAQGEPQTSATGALFSGAVESALPAVASIAAGARAAQYGSRLGLPGAIVAGIGGMIGGQKIGSAVQNWAVSKLPKDWQEALGQDEEQKEAYEKQHPIAHFIGGLVPFAVTMNPFAGAEKAASEGMTTFQKLAANPIASRLVSGTVMGGFEAGSEVVQGEHPDWAKIGISTAFGFVLNRSNRLGEAIEGVPSIHNPGTLAEANDLHILGPGATEEVFAGHEARNPSSAETARKTAQEEMSILGPKIEPDIHEVARSIHPEAIDKYDDLQRQRGVLKDWINEHQEAGTHESEEAQSVRQKLDEVDKQIYEAAPDRAAAYQRAADRIGPEQTTVLPQEVKQAEQSPEIMAKLSPPDRPLEVQRQAITDEITQNLVKAGRPEEEANAAAILASNHYETEAALFNGDRGTAEDIYKENFPIIQGKETLKRNANGYIENLFSKSRSIISLAKSANPSTFLHEMAHQWFADFVHNAQHPLAPEALKNDLQTTLKWMGVKNSELITKPEDIRTGLHERWARSFEQYAREGIAPSPELASVFGKFKNWLTSVYQTLKGLGKPISPEIKGVFDRMLAKNPERTVIAPEMERQPTMSDIHEDDANHIEPHPEAPHMDLMLSEAKQTVMDLPQEVKNEIEEKFRERLEASKPKGEGGPSPAGPTELEHGGEQSRLIPESVGGIKGNGEVSGRSGEDGAGVSSQISTRGTESGSISGKQGVNELSPVTTERFDRAPSREIDKAGNIVTSNLNTTEDIKSALKQFSTANGEYTELRDRRQLTEGEKIDIAGDLDLGIEKIGMIHKMSQIVSENIVAARHLIKRTASDWISARDQALASGSDEDLLKWHEATQRHNLVQGYLSGITANSGRALAYFRRKEMGFDYGGDLNEQAKGQTGKTLFQLRQDLEMSKTVDSIQKVSKFSTESTKLQWGKMPLEFMVNNLISNPITHSTYAIGNEMLKFVQSVPEKLVAAGIGEIRRSLGQERERVFAGEAGQYFAGQSLPGALKAAGEAFHMGAPAELPTEVVKRLELEKKQKEIDDAIKSVDPFVSVLEKEKRIKDLTAQRERVQQSINQAQIAEDLLKRTNRLKDAENIANKSEKNIEEKGFENPLLEKEDTLTLKAYKKEDLEKILTPEGEAKYTEKRKKELEKTTKTKSDLESKPETDNERKELEKRQKIRNLDKKIERLKDSLTPEGIVQERNKVQEKVNSLNKIDFEGKDAEGNKIEIVSDLAQNMKKAEGLEKEVKELRDSINPDQTSEMIERRKARIETLTKQIENLEKDIQLPMDSLIKQPGAELAERPIFNEQTTWSELRPDVLGMFKGVQDGFLTAADMISKGNEPLFSVKRSNLGYIPDINVKGVNLLPIGTAVRLPSRMVSAIHTFFTATTYSIEKNSYAYRTAKNEGLTGADFDQRVAGLRQNPPANKMEEFHKAAYGTALMGEPGELTKGMTKLLNTEIFGMRPLRFIAPFNQIFSNIARKTFLERTPLGILSSSIREDLMGHNGSVAQDLAQARMIVGSAMGLAAGALYYKGALSGSGPSDPIKNRQWREAGNQAHSIRIGDMWYDIGKLGPLGKLLSTGADLAETAHVLSHDGMSAAAAHLAHAGAQLFIEESPFGAMSNVMKAIEDPGKHGVNYASALISNFIPYSSALYQAERYTDPYSRQAHGFVEGLMKKIPGLGDDLLPRRDVWGQPIENLHSFGYGTSIHESQASHDPVRVFLASAGFNVGMPPKSIVGVPLNDNQYDDFVRISGTTAKLQLDKIVNSRDWARMPPEVKHKIFLSVVSGARNAARGQILRANPDIIQQAVTNKKKLTQPAEQEPEE